MSEVIVGWRDPQGFEMGQPFWDIRRGIEYRVPVKLDVGNEAALRGGPHMADDLMWLFSATLPHEPVEHEGYTVPLFEETPEQRERREWKARRR